MRLWKRMIGAFLAVCMVISMIPGMAVTADASADTAAGRIILDGTSLSGQSVVWVDGVAYPVTESGGSRFVALPDGAEPSSVVTYSYHVGDPGDIHTQYPVGMQVWALNRNADGSFTPEKVEALSNILQYSGSSIRITGNKGIRMITSMEQSKKNDLTSGGLAGYQLLEYGTVLSWTSDLAGGNSLVLGRDYARSNYAYKKDVADPVFAYSGNLMQYTNVLVGFTMDQCADDIAMRPYMILEKPDGSEMTIYGGTVHRSIGYIAWQNRNTFTPGSDAYEYVWEIIRHVYGDVYTVTFDSNGGSDVPSVDVPGGTIMTMPTEPALEGYAFAGWFIDEALTEPFDPSAEICENLTLYAKWTVPVSRGEWIQMLVDAYGYPTDAAVDQVSYSDIADSEYRVAIETAVIYGILAPAGMGEFHPEENATREFVAVTATNCMGYQPDGTFDCKDIYVITNPGAVKQALESGWLELENGHFYPNRAITPEEAAHILECLEETFNSANGDLNEITDGIVLLDGVVNKPGPFNWEAEGDMLIVPEGEDVPQIGQIITFGTEKAIRVESIENAEGKTKITYSIPQMHEYLDYIDVQGVAMMDFSQFVPAEGVTVTTNTAPSIQTYGFADDWFDVPAGSVGNVFVPTFEGDIDFGSGWKVNYSLEMNIPSVDYKFDVDFDANPFNDEPAVNVKNAYIKLQNDMTFHIDFGNGVDTGDEDFDDSIFDDLLEKEIPLGNVPLIGMNGLGAVVEIDLVITAQGVVELDYNVHGTIGVQVLNNRARNISALQSSASFGLAASFSVGPRLGLEVEIFDEDILDCYAEAGAKGEGSIHHRSTGLLCVDANCHMYAELVAFEDCLIDDWLDLTIGYEIWDAGNSPVKVVAHWENGEKVPECTYNESGTIKGTVANADNRTQYIQGANIQVFDHSDLTLKTTAVSDANGEYTAIVEDGGTVLIRISADGYIPFDTLQTVGVSQVVYLETFLMVEGSEDSGETGAIEGTITDAVMGNGISGVKLSIRKGWNMTSGEVIETVYTDGSGRYYVSLPLGNYTISMECDGYVSNHFNVAVSSLGNANANAVMNPDGSSSVDLGDMRIILTWASEPSDLDSHLWGPTVDGSSKFHIYYSNMTYSYNGTTCAYLDRDDTNYVGPETTTVYNMSPNGVYSFFIHDFTNRNTTGSTVMANSGAYVQVYVGETRVAVYHVPTSGVGNVWHVFDFDATNGRIMGVNTFSNNSNPSSVGAPTSTYSWRFETVPDKVTDEKMPAEENDVEATEDTPEMTEPEELVEETTESTPQVETRTVYLCLSQFGQGYTWTVETPNAVYDVTDETGGIYSVKLPVNTNTIILRGRSLDGTVVTSAEISLAEMWYTNCIVALVSENNGVFEVLLGSYNPETREVTFVPEEDTEATEPTETTEVTEATEATEATEPTEDAEPTEATEPTEVTEATESPTEATDGKPSEEIVNEITSDAGEEIIENTPEGSAA